MEDIKRHPWFRTIDWKQLETKGLEPPFVPDVRVSGLILSGSLTTAHSVEEGKL
jgi:hypothetical protein